jgi:hypothetical protein
MEVIGRIHDPANLSFYKRLVEPQSRCCFGDEEILLFSCYTD